MRRPERWRRRAAAPVVALLLATGAAACGSGGGSDDAATPLDQIEGTYVSLGDSYAQGYQPEVDGRQPDLRDGFAYLLPAAARAKGYDLDLVNYGCGGATVGSLLDDDGCSRSARAPGGPVYDEPQLDAAIEFLEANRGEVQLVTVSIGGNDVTACAEGEDPIPCVTTAVQRVRHRLGEALPRLREAAGPDTVIVGLTYPDVVLGAYVLDDPGAAELAGLSVVAFRELVNPMLREAYESVDGIFVDVTAGTGAYAPFSETTTLAPYGEVPSAVAEVCRLTWSCRVGDIHPRSAGYARIAELVVDALPPR